MEQDTTKGFWIDKIRVPDENGKCPGHLMTGWKGRIKVSLGKAKLDGYEWKMMFKTVLAPHIHEKLVGKSIERSRGGLTSKVDTHSYTLLGKTISSTSLDGLVKRYCDIVDDYLFLINDEQVPKEKLIFVNWKPQFDDKLQSYQNSCALGKKMSMEYHFFVGYWNGRTMFDVDHKAFNTVSYDKDLLAYERIPWTQEREDFFNNIYANFELFKDKLDAFFETMNAKTIDSHMSNFKMLT